MENTEIQEKVVDEFKDVIYDLRNFSSAVINLRIQTEIHRISYNKINESVVEYFTEKCNVQKAFELRDLFLEYTKKAEEITERMKTIEDKLEIFDKIENKCSNIESLLKEKGVLKN